jgi:hypothetical protein
MLTIFAPQVPGNTQPSQGFFSPRLDILPPPQRALWPDLREAAQMGFVLYGGTAIALRFGHRESVDFDFFSTKSFDHNEVIRRMPFLAKGTVLQEESHTLTFIVDATDPDQAPVKLSFFSTPDLGRIGEPEWTQDGVLLAASLRDLMALKLKVILQRLEKKDYQDVHALLRHGISLEDGLAGARAIYGRRFQPSEALKALTYFKGGDLQALSQDVRNDLIRAVAKVADPAPVPQLLSGLGGIE